MPTYSSSALIDATVAVLTAASEFSNNEVSSNDYNVLTTAPGACAIVVRFRGFDSEPLTYGLPRGKSVVTIMDVEGYIRDNGDPVGMLANTIKLSDDILNVLHQAEGLSGSAKKSMVTRGRVPAGVAVEDMGGFQWLPVLINLSAEQF